MLRQAVESLDMEPSDSGDLIRASAKRSLRRNRWASEIVNASLVDEHYRPVNPVVPIEL